MRPVLCLLLFPLLFCSCGYSLSVSHHHLGREVHGSRQPYVQLYHQEKINATTVTGKRDSVYADGTGYSKRDVIFYCDGQNTFGKLPNQQFATKILDGDINIYQMSTPYHPRGAPTRIAYRTDHYVQKEESPALRLLTYHNVKKMIGPGEDGYEYLKQYKSNRLKGNLGFYGGFALYFAGLALYAGSHYQFVGCFEGVNVAVISLTGMVTSALVLELNKGRNVQKAIAKHNHMME